VADVTIDASEVNKLAVDMIGHVGPEVIGKVREAVQVATIRTEGQAKIFCPVDTGFLRNSVGHEVHATPSGAWGQVGPTADYGAYVEYGTSRMSPQAYMGPAFDMNTPPFIRACELIAAASSDL
jgi:HK97 gp10 family phage protein